MNKKIVLFFIFFLTSYFLLFSQTSPKDRWQAKLNYYKERIRMPNLTYVDIGSTYDSIVFLCKKNNMPEEAIKYQLRKADLMSRNGYYFDATHNLKAILLQVDSLGSVVSTEYKKEALLQIVLNNYNTGMLDVATQYLTELLKLNNEENPNYEARAYSILGAILDSYNLGSEAKEKHEDAVRLLGENSEVENYTCHVVYSNYAGWFYKAKQYDSALYYLDFSEKYKDENTENKDREISNLQNRAIVYQAIGENAIAEECFLRALKLPSYNGVSRGKVICEQNLAYLYFEQKKFKEALYHYEQALTSAKKNTFEDIVASLKIEMAQVYYQKGEFKKAYDLYKEGKEKADLIFNMENTQKILEYKNQHETETLKNILEINKLKAKNKNILLAVLLTLFGISLVVIIWTLNKLLSRKKENEKLNQSLHVQVKEKTEEIEHSQIEYFENIQMKNMELTSHAMVLAKLKDCMDSIQEDVERLVQESDIDQRKSIARNIKNTVDFNKIGKNWDEFRLYFEQTYPTFFKKLNDKYPNLSLNEQRLCALLALNMRTKEIAEITHRSTRSIETFVYRIRKKLQIPAEVKTIVYFKDFL